jgi:hypothetical protein
LGFLPFHDIVPVSVEHLTLERHFLLSFLFQQVLQLAQGKELGSDDLACFSKGQTSTLALVLE